GNRPGCCQKVVLIWRDFADLGTLAASVSEVIVPANGSEGPSLWGLLCDECQARIHNTKTLFRVGPVLELPAMEQAKTVAVVIPARNEAPIIAAVLANVPAEIRSFKVLPLVIDDGSDDHTMRAAQRAGAHVVRHITNLGVGAATITGFR